MYLFGVLRFRTYAAVALFLSSYVMNRSQFSIRAIGVALQEGFHGTSLENMIGDNLAVEAIYEEQMEGLLEYYPGLGKLAPIQAPIPVFNIIGPATSKRYLIIIYCNEYGNAWWPG